MSVKANTRGGRTGCGSFVWEIGNLMGSVMGVNWMVSQPPTGPFRASRTRSSGLSFSKRRFGFGGRSDGGEAVAPSGGSAPSATGAEGVTVCEPVREADQPNQMLAMAVSTARPRNRGFVFIFQDRSEERFLALPRIIVGGDRSVTKADQNRDGFQDPRDEAGVGRDGNAGPVIRVRRGGSATLRGRRSCPAALRPGATAHIDPLLPARFRECRRGSPTPSG